MYLVAKSIGPKVEDILFATDSTIALSWCCNPTKKLRLFVFSRVEIETIRRMIEWTTGNELLPIYHVDGELNLADLLTKRHELSISDLSAGSVWQTGYPWMKMETMDMPLFPYQSLTIPKDVEEMIEEECFKEVSPPPEPVTPEMEFQGLGVGGNFSTAHSASLASPLLASRAGIDLLVDPVRLGWYRALRVLGHVVSFIAKIQARTGVIKNIRSRFCSEADLERVFFLYESRVIRQSMKAEQIRRFEDIEDILYYTLDSWIRPSSNLLTLISSRFWMFMKFQETYLWYYRTPLFSMHS